MISGLAACSSIENFVGGDKIDYRSSGTKTQGLEVPPDLTQLARDTRYQQPSGGNGQQAEPQIDWWGQYPTIMTLLSSNDVHDYYQKLGIDPQKLEAGASEES